LAISLLFVGLLAIYVLQKISQQNHKISSMVDLISTFSNEQAMLRNYMQQASINPMQATQANTVINVGGDSSRSISLKTTDNIIPVSDNETNNTDDSSSDEDSEVDDDSDSDTEDDDEDKDDDDVNDSEKDDVNDKDDDEDKDDVNDKDDDDVNDKIDDFDKEDTEIVPFDELEELEISKTNTNNTDFSELEIVADVETDNIKVLNIDMDLSFEKQNNDNDNDHDEEEGVIMDYKKASVSTLRSIAVKRGLVTADDSMRIKKADLVKLLESV
jgi:hypothetical protein